jgi:hypothetical protein
MSENQPAQQSGSPAAKPRNPVEKLLVRGLIAFLLVLVVIEAYFKMDHGKALAALQDKVSAVDKDPNSKPVTEADVKAILGDRKPSRTEEFGSQNPSRNGAKRLDVYSWFTLRPGSKREICVFYGTKSNKDDVAEVIAVQTDDVVELPKMVESNTPDITPPAGAGGAAMGGPGGMRVGTSSQGHGGPGGRRGGPAAAADAGADSKPAADDEKKDDEKKDDDKPADKTEKSDSDQE